MATKIAILLLVFAANVIVYVESGSVGVNFGRQTSQKLLPSMVVDMCLANKINKVKLFSANDGVLNAFTRSKIEVFLSVPNVEILYVNSSAKARNWVNMNLTRFINKMEVNIRYLSVCVEPFSLIELDRGYVGFLPKLPQTIKDMQIAINEAGIGDKVKMTIPHAADILKVVKKPSEGDFRDDIKETIVGITKNLYENGDVFTINIYPLYLCLNESYPTEFGQFDKRHNISIVDGNLTYTNMFDFKYDTLLWALEKNGFHGMKVLVGQVGWPTDGHPEATVENAKRFYEALFKKIGNNEGTPYRPGSEIDAYIYSFADENQRSLKRGPFERHYGIYTYDGLPKFNLDFTLQGRRDIELAEAIGVIYLPHRWCVLNKTAAIGKDDLVKHQMTLACNQGDCTALEKGASCGELEFADQVSYGFNSHFQMSNQDMSQITQACDYAGLGRIVEEEPDFGANCKFDIQILSTLFINAQSTGEMQATLGRQPSSGQDRVQFNFGLVNIMLLLLSFFLSFCITFQDRIY